MESRPDRMLTVLRGCGALSRLLPEVDKLWGVPQPAEHHPEIDTGVHLLMVLRCAAQLNAPLAVRYAALCHDLGKGSTPPAEWPRHIAHESRSAKLAAQMSERWKVPADCRELAVLTAREHGNVHRSGTLDAAATVRLLDRCDAWRRPERFAGLLLACECDARGRLGRETEPYPQRDRLTAALVLARSVDTTALAEAAATQGLAGPAIGQLVAAARVRALAAAAAAG